MKRPAFSSQTKNPESVVLVVDKIGVIGERLAKEYSKDFYVVLFSARPPSEKNDKISFISFKGKIPKVPQNNYSKIFIVDDGRLITKESSISFVEEAKSLGSDFYFLGSVRNFDIKHAGDLIKIYKKVKVLVFGDLFDEDYLFDQESSITKYIVSVANKRKIKVSGEGLFLNYPITLEDTIKLILKASYLKIPQNIILLFYKNPITDLSLAHIFQKIDPDIDVDFIESKKKKNLFIPEGAEYAISKYNLKKKIEESGLATSDKKIITEIKNKDTSKKNLKSFLIVLMLLLFVLLLPFIVTISYIHLGESQLKKSFISIQEGDYEKALKGAGNAESFFNVSKKTSVVILTPLAFVKKDYYFQSYVYKINLGSSISSALESFLTGASIINTVFAGESNSPKEDFKKGMEYLSNSYSELQKIEISNNRENMSYGNVNEVFKFIDLLNNTSDVLPDALGFDGEVSYLVVFQDNNELRPGGGKITAVGEIKIKNGSIESFDVISTNDLDKKLNVYVEPPFPLRRFLTAENLYLADSNFDPDFIEGAISTSAIYKLETGKDLDGVIGVDLYFLKNLLKEIGPVYIKESGINVSSDNVLQAFEEGSAADDRFAANFIEEVIVNFKRGERISISSLLNVFENSLSEKHMLIAFKDPGIQSVFTANNYSGSLSKSRTDSKNNINDFIGVSEANLGKNKINFFISRSVSKKNIIEGDGSFSSETIIAFKNASQRGSSFAKTYKNYIRVILPVDTKLDEVSIGGKKQNLIPAVADYTIYSDSRFSEPDELEIEQVNKGNKTMFGFLVSVPPDSVETIKLNYSLPFEVSSEENSITNYSLLIYKQPGIDTFPFSLSFDSSSSFTILPKDSYSFEVRKDEEIDLTISKN